MLLDTLQQVRDLLVGVTVVAILHRRVLVEQRVGLVEEQDPVAPACRLEQAGEALLGFAYILGDDDGEVDAVVHCSVVGNFLGR